MLIDPSMSQNRSVSSLNSLEKAKRSINGIVDVFSKRHINSSDLKKLSGWLVSDIGLQADDIGG